LFSGMKKKLSMKKRDPLLTSQKETTKKMHNPQGDQSKKKETKNRGGDPMCATEKRWEYENGPEGRRGSSFAKGPKTTEKLQGNCGPTGHS